MLEICRFSALALVCSAGLSGEPHLTAFSLYVLGALRKSPLHRDCLVKRVKVLQVGLGHEKSFKCLRIVMWKEISVISDTRSETELQRDRNGAQYNKLTIITVFGQKQARWRGCVACDRLSIK